VATAEAPAISTEEELEEARRRSREAAETGLTQAEREATVGWNPETATDTPRAPQQGTFAGEWETLIGGNRPTESKVKIVGGAISPTNAPETLLKGSRHRVLVEVVAVGYNARDRLDKETGEVASTGETRLLQIDGARFLDPEEYVTSESAPGEDVTGEF
jgi:hypothetical protein